MSLTAVTAGTPDQWIFRSLDPENKDIVLNFSDGNSCIVGRGDLAESCIHARHISSKHIEFQKSCNDENSLILTSRSTFDVTFIDSVTLLSKQTFAVVRSGSQVNLCRQYVRFRLELVRGEVVVDNSKKRRREEISTQEGAPSASKLDIAARHTAHIAPTASSVERGAGQTDLELSEAMQMAVLDVEASVYNRTQAKFANTKVLAKSLLSSFHCDICLEVIAGCRSCVPCGHSFCALCIKQYMAVKNNRAPCPNCRKPIEQIIPNKGIDAAVSDCLSSIRDAARAVPLSRKIPSAGRGRIIPSMASSSSSSSKNATNSKGEGDDEAAHMLPPATVARLLPPEVMVGESQDIHAWEERYEENESKSKAEVKSKISTAAPSIFARAPVVDYIMASLGNSGTIDCANAIVEPARSGRSRCIHCRDLIASSSLRFGVHEDSEMYYGNASVRFIHVRCGRAFNATRRAADLNVISLMSLQNVDLLSHSDRLLVEAALL